MTKKKKRKRAKGKTPDEQAGYCFEQADSAFAKWRRYTRLAAKWEAEHAEWSARGNRYAAKAEAANAFDSGADPLTERIADAATATPWNRNN